MNVIDGIILGLVLGFTEFLPISGTGHESIINNLFNIQTAADGHLMINAMIRIGCLLALVIVYWGELSSMIGQTMGFASAKSLSGRSKSGFSNTKLLIMVLFASIPLFFQIPLFEELRALIDNNIFVGIMFMLTGCLILVSEKMATGNKTEKSMSIFDAVIIGICRLVSAVPGLSGFGVSFGAGVATGLSRDFAIKFAYMLSIPYLFGSAIDTLTKAFGQGVQWSSMAAYFGAMGASLLSGIGAIVLVRKLSERVRFNSLAVYCMTVGVIFIILTLIF